MSAERFRAGEAQIAEPEADEPEWRTRVRAAVERSERRRAARSEERQMLAARRAAGLQTRHATRLARIDAAMREAP